MTNYLIFRLYGPMASWGDTAVGEVRPSYPYPSKSAVMGLIAAALGIERDEEGKLLRLAKEYSFAVRVDISGIPLTDYHTIQAPFSGTGRNKRTFSTRREEIFSQPRQDLSSIISKRDYYMDAHYTIALWSAVDNPPYELDYLAEKLTNPVFTLYLGRKSCPLSLPVEAQVISAGTLLEAIKSVRFTEFEEFEPLAKKKRHGLSILYWEKTDEAGIKPEHISKRRDMLLSRKRWQYENRIENHAAINEEG